MHPQFRPSVALVGGFFLLCSLLQAQVATTTSLTSVPPATSLFGQAVTLTATVTPPVATGSVAFIDRGVLVGVGSLNASGTAQVSTLTLPAGTHSLRAVYGGGGSGAFLPSQSAPVNYAVNALPGDGFAAPLNYPVGIHPVSLAVGDINGDGKLDLAAGNYDGRNISVLLGNGNGTFQSATNHDVGGGPASIAFGDFNGDGKLDLVLANSYLSSVGTLFGTGDGTFVTGVNYAAGFGPTSVAVEDFNRDGNADIVSTNIDALVRVQYGNGNGTFQAPLSFSPQICYLIRRWQLVISTVTGLQTWQ